MGYETDRGKGQGNFHVKRSIDGDVGLDKKVSRWEFDAGVGRGTDGLSLNSRKNTVTFKAEDVWVQALQKTMKILLVKCAQNKPLETRTTSLINIVRAFKPL